MERAVVYTAVDVRCCVQRNVFFFHDVYLLRYVSSSTPPEAQSIILSFLSLLTIEFDPMIHFSPPPPHFAFLFLPPLLPHSKNGWKVNHCQCQSRHYQCSAVRRRRRGVQRVFWVWLVKGGKWPGGGLAACRGKRKRRESVSLWAPLSAAAAANQPSTNHPPVAVGHRTHSPPPPPPPLVSASLPLLVRRFLMH